MYDLLTGTSAPVMSGFTDLDEVLGGFQRSDLVILAARPSVGKSTLGLNMAMANAKAGHTCAIFSLEMTADQLAIRALAAETGIDSHRIRLRLYTQSQEELMINAIGELSELPIYIDDTPYQGMVEIRGKARRLDLDRGVDLIMVDYLQLVQGQHRGGPVNRVNEITEISRSLKVMAGELNTAVIACSQMSRMVENRPSHRPQLSESELPIYIDDTPYQGMVEIRGKARRLDLDRGLDLIMVDYLQLVQGQHRGGPVNRVNEITEISRALKVMAGELNAAVIACSQMSRMVENRPSHRPQLSDLRDSGSIEQDADIVAFIHREDLYTTEEEWSQTHPGQEYPRNLAEIIVAKNRKGPTGSVRLEFRDHLVQVRLDGQGPTPRSPKTPLLTQNAAGSVRRHFLLPDASRWSVQSDHYRSSSKYIYL